MAKQDAKTAVPRLRFPEFRSGAAWNEAKLHDLIKTISPPAKLQSSSYLVEGAFPIIDQSQGAICGWTDDASAVVKEPLPLIIFGDHTCVVKFADKPFAQGADGIKILAAKPAISIEFLFHSLNHRPLMMQDYKRHFSELKKRLVFFSDVDSGEQQKIVDCLTSMDEVIAAQGRKVEALKAHKRGLMQQLFPREGETVPRLRFPEFLEAPGWRVRKLSALIKLVSGMHLSPDQYSSSGDIPYFTGPSDFTKDVDSVTKWTASSPSVAKKHDTLITVKGSGVGECWYLEMPSVAMGRQLMAVCPKASSSQFIHQFLLTKRSRLEDLASGNLIPGLARGDILDMFAPFPEQGEQQRIADCLSSLDNQIAAEIHQLAALKIHKQGLMQQVLPAPEGS